MDAVTALIHRKTKCQDFYREEALRWEVCAGSNIGVLEVRRKYKGRDELEDAALVRQSRARGEMVWRLQYGC